MRQSRLGLLTVMLAGVLGACGGGGGAVVSGCPPGQPPVGSSCAPPEPPACGADTLCGGLCCPAGQVCISTATAECGTPVACSDDSQCSGGRFCHQGTCVDTRECVFRPAPGRFEPRVAWQWTGGGSTLPQYNSVLMTPVVVPLSRGGDVFAPPAVVFNSTLEFSGGGEEEPAVMRAVDGRDGRDLWTSSESRLVNGLSAIAAGDLDGDGTVEFVTGRFTGLEEPVPGSSPPATRVPAAEQGLIAFGSGGQVLWETKGIPVHWGAPSIANLFGGREAQVIMGASVLDARGNVLCRGQLGQGDKFLGPISVVADVDLDGRPDLVTGNTVYALSTCPRDPPTSGPALLQPKPGWPAKNGAVLAPDGLVAVADLVGDAVGRTALRSTRLHCC